MNTSAPKQGDLVHLTERDLAGSDTVFCPHPKAHMAIWNTHPRVYLTVDEQGRAMCPYCGTHYQAPIHSSQH